MPDTQDAATVLTEAPAFHEARLLIERAKRDAFAALIATDDDRNRAYALGQLAEAIDAAGTAIFNALNIASSHCHCPASNEAIQAWFHRDETETPQAEAVA